MVEIKWTKQAINDVESISEYISRDSVYYAKMFAQKIFQSVDRLLIFPQSGRIVPELKNTIIREIILGNYRVIYRSHEQLVEIITVYHSSRLLNLDKVGQIIP